jgi:riboflavin biosynthesis pyrimidine reductase
VQQLHPTPHPADVTELYAGLTLPTPHGDGCWVALCMVSSLDGAAAVEGRSGGLGGEADRLALSRLRDATDAVLVGAATVRDEGYGPLTGDEHRRADRRARGLAEIPRLAIVTRSGNLDPEAAVFGDEAQRPLVLATTAGAEVARPRLGERAEVVALGDGEVEPRTALAHLASLGLRRVVCEGGPKLAAQMLAEDLIDEVFLTLAPVAVAGAAPRIAEQPGTEVPRRMQLRSLWEHDGELFLRYRHHRHSEP